MDHDKNSPSPPPGCRGLRRLRRLRDAPRPTLDQQALAMLKASFRDQGIAKVDRLNQDPAEDHAPARQRRLPTSVAIQIEATESLEARTLRTCINGLGDWRLGAGRSPRTAAA